MKKTADASGSDSGNSASDAISQRITELGDWRGETLARMRTLIHDADPDVTEAWKWMGTPIWEHDGIICTGESYKKVVKLTFAKGASLPDPTGLFNSSLEGNVRRAIDIAEGETIDAAAFKALVRAAIALNSSNRKPAKKSARTAGERPAKTAAKKAVKNAAKQPAKKPAKTAQGKTAASKPAAKKSASKVAKKTSR